MNVKGGCEAVAFISMPPLDINVSLMTLLPFVREPTPHSEPAMSSVQKPGVIRRGARVPRRSKVMIGLRDGRKLAADRQPCS